jgi:putative methylase
MLSKSSLAIILSKLKTFDTPSIQLEQYSTDSEIAAEILWNAYMNKDIEGKTIADFGCGTGILGIGALLLGAKKVYFVDLDKNALTLLKENILFVEEKTQDEFDYEIQNIPIEQFSEKVNIVIENPPFGTKIEHADKIFLEKAFKTADKIYSFHKTSTKKFVEAISKDHEFRITAEFKLNFPLKKTMEFHKKRIERFEVSCFRIEK